MTYEDRRHAGRMLAKRLSHFAGREDVVVLALPPGGVPVAYEVAGALGAPLDVLSVRKLSVPAQGDRAMGVIASGGVIVLDDQVIQTLRIRKPTIFAVVAREEGELVRTDRQYRRGRPAIALSGKTIILVDDGLATTSMMRAAIEVARTRNPSRIVVAIPAGSESSCRNLSEVADEVICPFKVDPIEAVALTYDHVPEPSDGEVSDLLEESSSRRPHEFA
jgi:predicted phosphoribosyltransferase